MYATHESENPRSDRLTDDEIAQIKEAAEKLRTNELDLINYPTEEEYFAAR